MDGGALVVSRTDLVDNGTSFRLFLNVNRSYPVVDKFDRSGGQRDYQPTAMAANHAA